MPVMGPNYSKDKADEFFNEVMKQLAEKHRIQDSEPWEKYMREKWKEERIKRNEVLRQAIHGLFELQGWEDW